jgi:hypothetical protein
MHPDGIHAFSCKLSWMLCGQAASCPCCTCSATWLQHLTGIQVGESRSFRITIPDDYPVDLWQVRRDQQQAFSGCVLRRHIQHMLPTNFPMLLPALNLV